MTILSNIEDDIAQTLALPLSTTGELLASMRSLIDVRERLSQLDSELSTRKTELERRMLEEHEQHGLDKFTGGGLTVSFDASAMRAKYDPDKWAAIVRWADETGNTHIVQRRLTDAKVIELVASGTALPDGLTLEQYTKISTKRI